MSANVTAILNASYTNRIQLVFNGFIVPFLNSTRSFDPTQDIEVYIDGVPAKVQYFTVDKTENRYLLFMASTFNLSASVQVIYHMASAAFADFLGNTVLGYATVASYSTSSGDTPSYPNGFPILDQKTGLYYNLSVTNRTFEYTPLSPAPTYAAPIVLIDGSSGNCYQLVLNDLSLSQTKVAYDPSAPLFIFLEDTNGRAVYTFTVTGGAFILNPYTASSPTIVTMRDPVTSIFYALSVSKGSLRTTPITLPEPPSFVPPIVLMDPGTGLFYQITFNEGSLNQAEVTNVTSAPVQYLLGDVITGDIYSLAISDGGLTSSYYSSGTPLQVPQGFLIQDSSTQQVYTVSIAYGGFQYTALVPPAVTLLDPYKNLYYHLVVNNGSLETVPTAANQNAVTSLPFTDISTSVSYLLEVVKGGLTLIS